MTPSERQALRELCAKATPGPWSVYRCSFAGEYGDGSNVPACGISTPERGRGDVFCDAAYDECHHIIETPDADFIAASRTALPTLLDRVEVLESLLRRADDWCHAEPEFADETIWDDIREALKVTP